PRGAPARTGPPRAGHTPTRRRRPPAARPGSVRSSGSRPPRRHPAASSLPSGPGRAVASTRVDLEFSAELVEWRRPAPDLRLTVPPDGCDSIRVEAAAASYGWGAVPVRARIGATTWETSLLPRNGGYVLPVKDVVRKAEGVVEGDTVTVGLTVAPRGGRQANGTSPTC